MAVKKNTVVEGNEPAVESSSQPANINCIVCRRIGVKGHKSSRGFEDMAEVGEEISLPREVAKKMQDIGAVKVKI